MTGLRPSRLPSAMRLALALSALFTVSAIVAGGVAWVLMGEELRARLYDDARVQAQALAAELEISGAGELARQIRAAGSFVGDTGTLYYFRPSDGAAAVGNMRLTQPFEGPRTLVTGSGMVLPGESHDHEGETWFAWGIHTPNGWIVVARDSQWITESQEVLIQSVAWALGVALLATVLLAFAVARRDVGRVARINRVLADVAEGDLAARYPREDMATDDLSEVATGINRMLERLQSNVERLTQVSTDIAHDLRSPLTRLRLRLEPQALRNDLPEDTRAAIANSLESLDGISASFDAILQLSQIETGNMALNAAPTDLRELTAEVHEMLQPVAEETAHILELHLPETPVCAYVNAELISQALINLVDNALRHTPPETRIRIAVESCDGTVRLTVCDNGPGIPAEERDRVTRRFYRLDRSRNRPGTGLGLSLVSAIARLHGGRLELTDNDPGTCARLELPARRK